MTFVNLIMLAGLTGVAVPLVLHLLSRAKYRTVNWGAMMFLVGADRRQRRNMRLRQWLLLAMRMMLVALIALAMSRPRLSQALPANLAGGHLAVAIIIDRSGSMTVKENDQIRMDAAKAAAIRILKQLDRGDEVTLLRVGDGAGDLGVSGDLPTLARVVADLQPDDGAANMAAALTRAMEVLERSEAASRELYIVGDRQKGNWSGLDAAWLAAWRKRLEKSPTPPRVAYVPVGGQETANVAVTSVMLANPPLVAQQPAEIEIRVQNFGTTAVTDLPLQLREDARTILQTTLTLAGGASTVVRAQTSFGRVGAHVLTASVTTADSMPDDARDLALWVGQPIPVLVISGDEREGSFRRESDFLRLGLAPWKTAGKPGADPATVNVIVSNQWQRLDVGQYPVVVLANVAQLSEMQARELEQYVYSGGSALITAGSLTQAAAYNRLLYRGGDGILPAELGDSLSREAQLPTTILGVDLAHPAMRFLRDRPDPVPVATIMRRVPIRAMRPEARTLMTLANGEPLLLESEIGKGRVMLLASSIDADWNSLPLTGFYLPFVQSLTRYLASGQLPELNLSLGSPIVLQVRGAAPASPPSILLPDGRKDAVKVVTTPVATELRYAGTSQTGRYVITAKLGGEERRWILAVSPPAGESDLTPLDTATLKGLQEAGVAILDAGASDFDDRIGRQRQGRELWLPLLVAALLVGVGEVVVGRVWAK